MLRPMPQNDSQCRLLIQTNPVTYVLKVYQSQSECYSGASQESRGKQVVQ